MTRQCHSMNRPIPRHAPTFGAAIASTLLTSMSLAAHAQGAAASAPTAAASQAETSDAQVVTAT